MSLAWKLNHPEEAKASTKRSRQKNAPKYRPHLRDYQRERRRKNPEKVHAYERAYYAKNKDRIRMNWLKAKYGITEDKFNELLATQNNRCAICIRPFDKVPHVDHDHATGNVRGLTCSFCNRALGLFRDEPETLRRAADYLESNTQFYLGGNECQHLRQVR